MKNLATFFFQMLQKSSSKICISRSTFYSLVSQFVEDSTSVRDKPRSGRPAEAVTPTMVTNVQGFVNKDSRMPLQEEAYQFSIGKASTRKIRYGRLVLGGCRNR